MMNKLQALFRRRRQPLHVDLQKAKEVNGDSRPPEERLVIPERWVITRPGSTDDVTDEGL